jgi:hypothetical protein
MATLRLPHKKTTSARWMLTLRISQNLLQLQLANPLAYGWMEHLFIDLTVDLPKIRGLGGASAFSNLISCLCTNVRRIHIRGVNLCCETQGFGSIWASLFWFL